MFATTLRYCRRGVIVAAWCCGALAGGCGLALNDEDDENRRILLTLNDPAFEALCLDRYDLDGDRRLSRYEAQRVVDLSCPDCGIASLEELGEFTSLRRLDCRGNDLTKLDLTSLRHLESVECGGNRLTSLRIAGLRALTRLGCSDNRLPVLDTGGCAGLASLDARQNDFTTLDLSSCASTLRADVRSNPALAVVYCRAGQGISTDGITRTEER